MPAPAIRRRWLRSAPSSKAPSASNGVMLITKVLASDGSGVTTPRSDTTHSILGADELEQPLCIAG